MIKRKISNVFCLTLALVLVNCSKRDVHDESEPLQVQTKEVITKDIPIEICSFGTLSAHKDVDIKSQISGQIKKIYFNEGSFVKKGDLLISLEDEQYKANLRIDEAVLAQYVEDYKYQKHILEKDESLYKTGSIPKQTYKKMQTDFAQTEARLKSAQAKIDLDKILMKYCLITAPVDGVIGYIKVDEGSVITSSGDVLANVKAIDPLYIDFSIPSKELFRIKNVLKNRHDIKVIVSVSSKNNDNSDTDISYEGSLKSLENEVEDNSGTILLRGIIPNPKMYLLPGLFVNVKLIIGKLKNAILIPEEGVIFDNDKYYFFIVSKDAKAQRISTNVIGSYQNYCIVADSDNIKAGDMVVVTGLLDINPNDKIRVQK